MSAYHLNWITDQLAVGHAPMSYAELDSLREQGIDAVVNLCGEYCDLHEIERRAGFDVYYLPVTDNEAPRLEELEKALDWLDEAIYLGKKVLIHCRFGVGRTGTFVTAYLLRRGFGLKLAKQTLKNLRSAPASFNQWWLLRRYGRKEGTLTLREPTLEMSHLVDLSTFFSEYEEILYEADRSFLDWSVEVPRLESCGLGTDACCGRFLQLQFIETVYLNHQLNRQLTSEERRETIRRGVEAGQRYRGSRMPDGDPGGADERYRCPLSVDRLCILYEYRPLVCRIYGIPVVYHGRICWWAIEPDKASEELRPFDLDQASRKLNAVSRRLFHALTALPLEDRSLIFPITHVVSGKFVEDYFEFLLHTGAKRSSSGRA